MNLSPLEILANHQASLKKNTTSNTETENPRAMENQRKVSSHRLGE